MDQEKFVSTDEVREYTNIFANVFGEIQKKLKKNNGLTYNTCCSVFQHGTS